MSASILRVHPADDLIVALRDLKAGQQVEDWSLRENIDAKHKFAAHDFAAGDLITMYGVTVGRAMHDIPAGTYEAVVLSAVAVRASVRLMVIH